ncbi:amine oxidase [copper-containing] zeta, peroxisomal-like isoform X2 [Magnolia sinica]|uniref:amine oxidase [copper-containing] zeta, peroxisomal-like isoform X2 n=1 Tax=Magnolia sinica TaxID=86752 RepID=UPI00265A5012|nr:amine oxidase [copper-containing] zeta, peroxisomal-like isoform X2 [Magnolia sinica]
MWYDYSSSDDSSWFAISIFEDQETYLWSHHICKAQQNNVEITATVHSRERLPRSEDGKIEAEVKLTGILSLGALQPGESRKYGTTITHGSYAPVHQHFFVACMDMVMDCRPGETFNQSCQDAFRYQH